jgi:hypothetical protein
MTYYRFHGTDANGKPLVGQVEADNIAEAMKAALEVTPGADIPYWQQIPAPLLPPDRKSVV